MKRGSRSHGPANPAGAPRPQGQQRQGFVSEEPYESEFDYTYDSVMRTYEDSLRRLQRDRIDILYVHDIGRFAHGDNHPQRFKEFLDVHA